MTHPICSGYTLFQGHLPAQTFTELSRLFSKQTLALAGSTHDTHSVQVMCTGLRPNQVLPNTLLEQLTWLLLNAPDCDLLLQPLYQAMHSEKTVTISAAYSVLELHDLIESGVIAVLRQSSSVSSTEQSPKTCLRACVERQSAQVISRPLFSPTDVDKTAYRLKPRSLVKHCQRTWIQSRRWLVHKLKQQLTLEQKIWLKQRWINLCQRLGREHHPDDHAGSLARLKAWPAFTRRSDIALRNQTETETDTRIAVLMAVHWLELGGAEKFALDLIRALPKEQYKIYVTTAVTSGNHWAEFIADDIEALFQLPDFLQPDMLGYFYEYLIRSRSIRLLHIHHAASAYQALHHIRRFHPELKVLDTLHIIELPPHSGGYPEYSAGHFDVFIDCHHVISRQLQQFLVQRWLVDANKIRVIYLNVDADYFDPAAVPTGTVRTRHRIPESACLVGFIGRLEAQKQPLRFVQMAHHLSQRWQQTEQPNELHFVMVGSGLLEEEIRIAIDQYGLANRAHLHGAMNDTRLAYRDCDVLAMPSENEGLALVSYESQAMQTPIFFTDVGAQSELLDPEFLVPYDADCANHLAKALWPWLLDPNKRQVAGRAARDAILKHHASKDTDASLLALYEELLADAS